MDSFEIALDAATRLGWSIIPADLNKQPLVAWKRYQTERATLEQIHQWQDQYKPSAWGVVTGAISDIFVLDFDGEHGVNTMQKWELEPHIRTGSGGFHVYFKYPGRHVNNVSAIKNKISGEQWKGVDIRGDGGYAIFTGKSHKGLYQQEQEIQLLTLDTLLPDVRQAIIEDYPQEGSQDTYDPFEPDTTYAEPDQELLKRIIGEALKKVSELEGRNNTCLWLACQLRDNGFDDSYIAGGVQRYQELVPETNARGEYEPFTWDEAKACIVSALNGTKREPWKANGKKVSKDEYQHADDYGNAEVLYDLHPHDFLYCGALGWLHWSNTHWDIDSDNTRVNRAAIDALRQRHMQAFDRGNTAIMLATKADERRVNGCASAFKTFVSSSIGEFNDDPYAINTQSGVVDLRTGQVVAHCTDQRFTYCVRAPYDPTADMGTWIESLYANVESLLPYNEQKEVIDFLQLCAGYWLTGLTREEKFFSLYGPLRAGKGTFIEVLQELLPFPLSSAMDFDSLVQKRDPGGQNFDLASLQPCRMVFTSESNRHLRLDTHKLKSLTGGDHVHCAHKHKEFFTYRPQFMLVVVSNWPLNIDVDDDAAWYRPIIFHFPMKRDESEDTHFKERLKTPENLAGALRWLIEGSKLYHQLSNGLIAPQALKDNKQKQRDEVDYVKQWLNECCEDTPGSFTGHAQLYKSHQYWCKQNGVQPCGSRTFTQRLNNKGYKSDRNSKLRGFLDISFNAEAKIALPYLWDF